MRNRGEARGGGQICRTRDWSLHMAVFVIGFLLISMNLVFFQFDDNNHKNRARKRTTTTKDPSPTTRPSRQYPQQQGEPAIIIETPSTIATADAVVTPHPATKNNNKAESHLHDHDMIETLPSSAVSTHINDQPFVPPPWVQTYIDFHKSQVQKRNMDATTANQNNAATGFVSSSSRWLQWYCNDKDDGLRHCGGLVGRIKGMMEALVLAMVDQRVLLLEEWEGSPRSPLRNASTTTTGTERRHHLLTDYLQPNTINWNLPAPNATLTSSSTNTVEEFPTFVDAVGLSKSQAQRIVKSAPCTINLPHNTVMGVRFTGNLLTDEDTLTAPGCDGKFGTDPSTVYANLFWTLFRFAPIVHAEADRLRGPRIIPKYRNYYVAVHVSTGNFSDTASDHLRPISNRQKRVEAWDQFAACIQAVTTSIQGRCGGDTPITYLASDNANAKAYIQQKVGGLAPLHAPDVEMMQNDTTSKQYHGDDGDNQQAGYKAAMSELKILMDATCIIISDSGVSRMAKSLSRQRPRCAIAYDRCSDPNEVAKQTATVPCPQ